jgi:hypothetical protein
MAAESGQATRVNATLRLLQLLEKMDHSASAKPLIHVLQESLGMRPEEDPGSAFRAYAVLSRMLDLAEIESQKHLADEWDMVGPHFRGVRGCLTPSASGLPWNQRKSGLTSADLTGLRHTARHLAKTVNENLIPDTEFANLQGAIRDMYSALDSQDLSEHTRRTLREHLEAVETAVDEYAFWGVSGLRVSYRNLIAVIVTDQDVQTGLKKDQKGNGGFCKKAGLVLGLLGGLLTVADKAHVVIQEYLPIERLILPSPARVAPPIPSDVET